MILGHLSLMLARLTTGDLLALRPLGDMGDLERTGLADLARLLLRESLLLTGLLDGDLQSCNDVSLRRVISLTLHQWQQQMLSSKLIWLISPSISHAERPCSTASQASKVYKENIHRLPDLTEASPAARRPRSCAVHLIVGHYECAS